MHVAESNIKPGCDAHDMFMNALNARLAQARERLSAAGEPTERRRADRRRYTYMQMVAPYEGEVPGRPTFREVQCYDLSTSGFSFFTSRKPNYEFMVVELGVSPNVIYVTARIRRIAERPDDPQARYLIGCEFMNRVCL